MATATMEPAWGEVVATIDANGQRTDLVFDLLGRLTSVWLPGQVMGTNPANMTYQYLVRTNGAVAVPTQTLNPAGNYVTSSPSTTGCCGRGRRKSPRPAGPAA